jgi:hypothetical protein
MATLDSLKGGAAKAFQANSKARINALVDSKLNKAPTTARGVPNTRKAEGAATATPRAAQARGTAGATARIPGVTRQTMEAVGNKGGKVDRRA